MKKYILFLIFILAQLSINAQSIDPIASTVDTSKYATLYVYRPSSIVGVAIGYDLYVDDKVVCRIKSGVKYAIKVYKEGTIEVWGQTESKESITLNVKFGEEYYIKCGLSPGFAVGRPSLLIEEKNIGKEKYLKIKKKK
jgi:hypothetical protein